VSGSVLLARPGRSTFRPRTAAAAPTVASARETRATKVDRGRIRERVQQTLSAFLLVRRTCCACIERIFNNSLFSRLYHRPVAGSISSGLSSIARYGDRRPTSCHGKINVGSRGVLALFRGSPCIHTCTTYVAQPCY